MPQSLGAMTILLLLLPCGAHAQCESRNDPYMASLDLVPIARQYYTLCYDEAHRDDAELVQQWIEAALRIGSEKYGVMEPNYRGTRMHMTVFLPRSPTPYTSRGRVVNFCCHADGDLIRSEMHYLTPAAWGSGPLGGLRYENHDDYHAHYVVHEMINLIHYGVEGDDHIDSWIREGLAEYDGYFHTTEWNRTEAIYRLFDHSKETNLPTSIYCCRTLRTDTAAMGTTDVYYGGALVMMFLAEHFGEEFHPELFAAPMADLMLARGTTVDEAFTRFQTWYTEKLEEVEDSRRVPRTDYTPSMACTGWYSHRDSGQITFEVRILNNDQRPAEHEIFQQQYRPDASQSWTTASGFIGIPLNFSTSNIATPLFTSTSSPPFQWRARSCPSQTDNACSDWSNVIDWTAVSCASRTSSGRGSTFTDHPLVAGSTPLRATHFRELRQRIENLRDRENLPPMQWTDPTLRAGVTPVRRVHLTELRTAIDAVYVATGRTRPGYTDAVVTAQATVIKAVHVMELREAVVALESALAPSLRYSTERAPTDSTDWHRHLGAADVDAWAGKEPKPPEEQHDQGDDRHEARVSLQ